MRPRVTSTERYAVLRALADEIVAVRPGQRIAVAIDGVDGAGKTVLADQLAEVIAGARHVLRVPVDGFHRSRAERYGPARQRQVRKGPRP